MPFSRITTNFILENESRFIDTFHETMMRVLKIPDYDRFVLLEQKSEGFYQPTNTSGKYIVIEIDMFSGRTIATKRQLYKDLVVLANSVGIVSSNVTIILRDIDKENWGIRGGQPASEVELGFKTDI
ncbi:tautomerase family protein [Desulfopila aestuarii]|uniref:Tautomerase enzyme n=1 Tax=Desulfopila aestuarii DSM 18488 TaxID=1121416 RepID=A0A1M7XXN7_9BACT|nr:tautomerase family protein [Desulfopila aestuarii]SHO43704.1 Tautomerase enzyme [Desulfopila aestuarii DSM 18488]